MAGADLRRQENRYRLTSTPVFSPLHHFWPAHVSMHMCIVYVYISILTEIPIFLSVFKCTGHSCLVFSNTGDTETQQEVIISFSSSLLSMKYASISTWPISTISSIRKLMKTITKYSVGIHFDNSPISNCSLMPYDGF
jgi:hypothetical protein